MEHPVGGRLPPRFAAAEFRALAAQVEALRGILPGHGHARLAELPRAARAEARRGARCEAARAWYLGARNTSGRVSNSNVRLPPDPGRLHVARPRIPC